MTEAEERAAAARAWRNRRLQETDWTQTADAPRRLSAAQIAAWADYRQALADWPATPGFPESGHPVPPQ